MNKLYCSDVGLYERLLKRLLCEPIYIPVGRLSVICDATLNTLRLLNDSRSRFKNIADSDIYGMCLCQEHSISL